MTIPRLRQYREELVPKVSQDVFAREASMTVATYAHIERGRTTTNKTGKKILVALNRLRVKQGLQELKFEDLELTIA